MKLLSKVKSWYSFEEAAKRLSLDFSEEVTPEDVIQLAADGHILDIPAPRALRAAMFD
jgi:hypothetical protein